jgi:hypothetical protein
MRRCQENFKATIGDTKKDKLGQEEKKAELEFETKQPTLPRQVMPASGGSERALYRWRARSDHVTVDSWCIYAR